MKRFIKYFITISIIVGIGIASWLFYIYLEIKFDLDKLVNYQPNMSTQFYDTNGKLVANIFEEHHRLYVKFDKIPTRITEALIAIEDTQFFEHNGINIEAIFRAILKDVKALSFVEGASTITQQLVKTVILTREKKLTRKAKEMFLAIELETILTKQEILERYFNHVYFGHGYYGIKTASKGYFKKELRELSIKEIAMLVGIPKSPRFYDPTKNYKHNISRANNVVRRLDKLGWINKAEFKQAIASMPKVYNDTLSLNKAPYVVDRAIKELELMGIDDLRTKAYKIKLTIDLDTQQMARESLKFGYDNIIKRDKNHGTKKSKTKKINGAIVAMDIKTGKVLAIVGGVDYAKSSFNRATQSKRQPGSSVKPFLYQIALNLGYSTVSTLIDISRTFGTGKDAWTPKNYGNKQKGVVRFNDALIHSRNLATINLATDIGIDLLYKKLDKFGFENVPRDLSIVLGSFGISPLAMSEKFSLFSNGGKMIKPYLIENITTHDGRTKEFNTTTKEYFSEAQAYLTTSMLRDVVTKGTARRAKVPGLQVAGKTGTSNKNIDAWFCGYSPSVQVVVWYGNDDNTPMRRSETGGTTAAPVFSHFLKAWLAKHPNTKKYFVRPKGVFTQEVRGQNFLFTKKSNVPPEYMEPAIYDGDQTQEFDPVIF